MRDKPTKWGYKLFVLADSNNVNVNHVDVNHLGSGYHIYVDNFYTSAMLFSHLHHSKFGACGTVRERRLGFPQAQANALPKSAVRGIRENPLLYVKCAVKQYNKYMGGVDLSDALIKYYTVDRKTSRWYMKLFLHLIDISVVNSFILHKVMAEAKDEKPMRQKRFCILLLEQLGSVGKVEASTSREGAVGATVSLPGKQCLPVHVCPLSSDPAQKATQGRRSPNCSRSHQLLGNHVTWYPRLSCEGPEDGSVEEAEVEALHK
ncbi:hypothetical protein ACEWY4_019114 [Coilia grayii]|uniref:PiggyBac transposable element-derived protein domain-containing protein n=1 Tax=Coilia grayii TaxID=363190 RepID=A0ABD1JGB1_9TELE